MLPDRVAQTDRAHLSRLIHSGSSVKRQQAVELVIEPPGSYNKAGEGIRHNRLLKQKADDSCEYAGVSFAPVPRR